LLVAAVLSLFLGALPAKAGELQIRKAHLDEIEQHITQRDFAWLDATERKWRVERARTASGTWKLQLFYNGMWYLGRMNRSAGCNDPAEAMLAQWRKHSPSSPAPFIASAQRLLDRAWCHRGSGPARTVPDQSWKPFHHYVNEAHEMLVQHRSMASTDPQYYAVLASIYVADARPAAEFATLIKEATARHADYGPFYFQAFRYFQPQWFGSYEDEDALAKLAVRLTRAKERSSMFARIYWHAMECHCLPPPGAMDIGTLAMGMNDLAQLYPDPWSIAHMAKMSCAIRQGGMARHYFLSLPSGDAGQDAWMDWDKVDTAAWQRCRQLAGL
jgi:hypothetical protein